MTPQENLDKIMALMQRHVYQIEQDAMRTTKDGLRGFTGTDAAVLERYAKVLLQMTKALPDDDSMDHLSDAELEAIKRGDDNVDNSSDEE